MIDQLVERMRVSVMIFDYRGYGRSTAPSEAGVLANGPGRAPLAGQARACPSGRLYSWENRSAAA